MKLGNENLGKPEYSKYLAASEAFLHGGADLSRTLYVTGMPEMKGTLAGKEPLLLIQGEAQIAMGFYPFLPGNRFSDISLEVTKVFEQLRLLNARSKVLYFSTGAQLIGAMGNYTEQIEEVALYCPLLGKDGFSKEGLVGNLAGPVGKMLKMQMTNQFIQNEGRVLRKLLESGVPVRAFVADNDDQVDNANTVRAMEMLGIPTFALPGGHEVSKADLLKIIGWQQQ